jgi:hypothetical protein
MIAAPDFWRRNDGWTVIGSHRVRAGRTSPPGGLSCDAPVCSSPSQWQVTTVDVGRHDTDATGRRRGDLESGRAWLQFCLVPPGADQAHPELIRSQTEWVQVYGVD